MCLLFCYCVIQGVSFNYHHRNVRSRVSVSNFQVQVSVSAFTTKSWSSEPGLGLGFYDKVSVSSRNLSQVSVSEVTVSTTSLLMRAGVTKDQFQFTERWFATCNIYNCLRQHYLQSISKNVRT